MFVVSGKALTPTFMGLTPLNSSLRQNKISSRFLTQILQKCTYLLSKTFRRVLAGTSEISLNHPVLRSLCALLLGSPITLKRIQRLFHRLQQTLHSRKILHMETFLLVCQWPNVPHCWKDFRRDGMVVVFRAGCDQFSMSLRHLHTPRFRAQATRDEKALARPIVSLSPGLLSRTGSEN